MDRIGYIGIYGKIFRTQIPMVQDISSTLLGPSLSRALFYSDLASDIFMCINLYRNCHFKYFITSMIIIILSYLTTVFYLRLRTKRDWNIAFGYPYYHGKGILIRFKSYFTGEKLSEETDNERIIENHIIFIETISESILQLCLSFLLVHQFGIISSGFWRFIQISSLITSTLSIYLTFSKVSKFQNI